MGRSIINANTINFEVELAALNTENTWKPSKTVLYAIKEKNMPLNV